METEILKERNTVSKTKTLLGGLTAGQRWQSQGQ